MGSCPDTDIDPDLDSSVSLLFHQNSYQEMKIKNENETN